MNDVPMNALCRTTEIDLRQMLGASDLPASEAAIDGLLYWRQTARAAVAARHTSTRVPNGGARLALCGAP